MQVLAYPAEYSGDRSSLPLVKTKEGEDLLYIEFGPHVDLDMIALFIIGSRRGCQWILLKDSPIVRDEIQWVDIPTQV